MRLRTIAVNLWIGSVVLAMIGFYGAAGIWSFVCLGYVAASLVLLLFLAGQSKGPGE